MWYDAKIVSRKDSTHEGGCSCLFSVILYEDRTKNGNRMNVSFNRSESVTIDRIAILQKLNYEICADKFYRWRCSEDCTVFSRIKLLSGLVSSHVSWLIVLSVLKELCFHIKFVQGNIIYQILERKQMLIDHSKLFYVNPDEGINTLHFKQFVDYSRPVVKTFSPFVLRRIMEGEIKNEQKIKGTEVVDDEADIEVLFDKKSLRRSKRQKIQPDRFTSDSSTMFAYKPKRCRAGIQNQLENRIKKHQKNYFMGCSSGNMDHYLKIIKALDAEQLKHRKQNQSSSLTVEQHLDNSEFCQLKLNSGNVECENLARKTLLHENFRQFQSQNPHRLDAVEICEEHPSESQDRLKDHDIGNWKQSDQFASCSSTILDRSVKRNRERDTYQFENKKLKQFTSLAVEEQYLNNSELCQIKMNFGETECATPFQSSARTNLLNENFKEVESQYLCKPDAEELHEGHPIESQNRLKRHGLGDLIQPDCSSSYSSTNFGHNWKVNKRSHVDHFEHRNCKPKTCNEQHSSNFEFSSIKKSSGNAECEVHLQTSSGKNLSVESFKEFQSLNPCRLDAEEFFEEHPIKLQDKLKERGVGEGKPRKRGRPRFRDKEGFYSCRSDSFYHMKSSNRKKLRSALDANEIIQECIGHIKAEMEVEFQQKAQPEHEQVDLEGDEDFIWPTASTVEIEVEEHEDLWKEKDYLLTKLALLEQKQELETDSFGRILLGSSKASDQLCLHDFILDEQIGIICRFCNFLCIDIRDIMPPFIMTDGRNSNKEHWDKEGFHKLKSFILELSTSGNAISHIDLASFSGNDTIWALIPELKLKLYDHQKKAFEFIWRNIAGSLNPKNMEIKPGSTGGCIISHTPGSGKTFLLISFIISYLTLFPKCRPLVLAPKIAIFVWRKEFEKWGVQFPLHIMHPFESYRKETLDGKTSVSFMDQRKPNMRFGHVIDCLTKLQKWHEESSILLMSYSSFSLMQEDSKFEHKKFMARVLRESPGLLILDEGHNPRSTKSKLRNLLMEVKTNSRVLLSGTLFQNNFEEYFNTLCLARPSFVDVVLQKFTPGNLTMRKFSDNKRQKGEKLARKLFVQRIGEKISSSIEDDRKQGFDVLNHITNGFIDVFLNANPNKLPGLHIYTLVLMPTDIQHEILARLQSHLKQSGRFSLGLELLISLGSIHPWLINSTANATDFFSDSELKNIEKHKENIMCGCKVQFVFDLVHKVTIKGEKVLIFSHNISPINFLVKFFENLLGWHKGDEVLVLQGEQELSQRAKIMEKFNGDVENKCKVLIASTSACAEGISLTAASRVVLLDSEWNHAKTSQAIARAFRPGQERVVFVYKLLASGTWEEDKYRRNECKAWLSKMIYIGQYIKHNSSRKVDAVEDVLLTELMEEDQGHMFKMIMRQD